MKKAKLLFAFLVFSFGALAQPFSGGDGTINDPYQINSAEQLYLVRDYLTSSFILINDIDLDIAPYNSGDGWLPIGDNAGPFMGTFDGNNFSIRNLYVNRPATDYIGLFGQTGQAEIQNLAIENCDITGNNIVGTLVGFNDNSEIIRCFSSGKISGNDYVGGLIGWQSVGGTASFCYSYAKVSGVEMVGGISGRNHYGLVEYCFSTGEVSGIDQVGGLIGLNFHGTITNSYSTGNVSGENEVGGLTGTNDNAPITDCYSTADVSGLFQVGGLSGLNNGEINNCYAVGNVKSDNVVGGVVGENAVTGIIEASYFNMETSAQANGVGLNNGTDLSVGLNTIEMKNQESFVDWNFDDAWFIRADSTYPGLILLNNAPFAFRDTFYVNKAKKLIHLLTNDFDIENKEQKLVYEIKNAYGLGSYDDTHMYRFSDITNIGQVDSVIYRIGEVVTQQDTLWGNTAVVVLINSEPHAGKDVLYTLKNSPITFSRSFILSNDLYPEDNQFVWGGFSSFYPLHGSFTSDAESFTYTPDLNYVGIDTLKYTISDGQLTKIGEVIIHVYLSDIILDEVLVVSDGCSDEVVLEYTVLSGSPSEYLISFNGSAIDAGFTNIGFNPLPPDNEIRFAVPANVFGSFSGTLTLRNSQSESGPYSFNFTVHPSANLLVSKFNDVILVDNSSGLFVGFQWYKNSQIINGATGQFYNDPPGLSGTYYAQLLTKNGDVVVTCPVTINHTGSGRIHVNAYPNPSTNGQSINLNITGLNDDDLSGALLTIINNQGKIIYQDENVKTFNSLNLQGNSGIYFIRITTKEGREFTNKLILTK